MQRWKIRTMIFILLAVSGVANAETFISKPHGVSFETPTGMSVSDNEFDNRIARLDKKGVGSIYVRRVDGQHGKIEKTANDRFARLPSGVSLGNFLDSTIGGKKVSSAAFEFPSRKIKGTVFYTAAPDGLVEIFCAAEEAKHLEIFFDCVSLVESLKFKIPSPLVGEGKGEGKRCSNHFSPIETVEENPDLIEMEIFENGLDLSGACGAISWHRAALGVLRLDPSEAKRWLLFAIESDRSYIPAYILLARMKLAGGEDAGTVVNEINRLLDRAPQNEEILKLKEKLAIIAYKTE